MGTDRPLPGDIGRYETVRLLGRGAMGRVYLAHDPVLDRDVAVKLLRDDLDVPPEHRSGLLERMRQEARASARVSHPNIVALHDMGMDPELGLFLVFEFVEGATLEEKLESGPLGPLGAARMARELGNALTTAHTAGVLHRDIKPQNVVLARTGAKIADFGIARVPDSTLTRDGGLLGTPAYSAPEAIADGTFSPSSDQFSMAATLYEAISGRRAFPGDDAVAVASRISTEEPPPIAAVCGLDRHVDTIFARAMSKNPRSRYPSCEEFGHALAEALEIAPRTVMATIPDEHHGRHPGSTPQVHATRAKRIAIGAAAVGALVAIAGFQLTKPLRETDAKTSNDRLQAPAGPLPDPGEPPVAWLEESPHKPRSFPRRRLHGSRRPASDGARADAAPRDAGRSHLRDGAREGAAAVRLDGSAPPTANDGKH